MRVYAIRTGCYSDTSWGPVFSTPERALGYKKAHEKKEPDIDIEVHVVDDENDTGPVYPLWRLLFNAQGDVVWYGHYDPMPYEPALIKAPFISRVPNGGPWYPYKLELGAVLLVEEVQGRDLKHAVKIAADARAMFLATPGR